VKQPADAAAAVAAALAREGPVAAVAQAVGRADRRCLRK
jgi:hypothetical protein